MKVLIINGSRLNSELRQINRKKAMDETPD